MGEHDDRPGEEHIRRTRHLARVLVPAMREAARRMGYALTVHGSLERDIDLVAIPWREGALDASSLAADLYAVCQAVLGLVTGPAGWTPEAKFDPPTGSLPNPTRKPHGRLAWVIHLGVTYIDLSVMPRVAPPPEETPRGET